MISKIPWQDKLFLTKSVKQKCKEFRLNGYPAINEADIWDYLSYCWQKQACQTLAEKKAAIEAIAFNDYFDYQRIKAQTKPPQEFDWEDMTDIL